MASPSPSQPPPAGDSGAESSDGEAPLFRFPLRGDFKRKVDSDEEDSAGDDSDAADGDESGSDDDGAFNSSPEVSRVRGTLAGKSAGAAGSSFDILSSDDEVFTAPAPKQRRVLDEAALQAKANALIDDCLAGDGSDAAGARMSARRAADRDYDRKMKAKIEAASSFDLPPRRGPSTCTAGAGASAAAAAVTAAATEATAARIRRELSSKRVRLLVVRSKTQQHYFKTKLGKGVGAIVEACKAELALLSRHEEDSELCLYFQDAPLDARKTLVDAGIKNDATLRLEVKGAACAFMGPPISLKVRIQGGKTFTAEITKDTMFSAFMESFNAAVGIPPERASESVFQFDGDNLNPKGTPEDEDMDSGELIDAKLPADLMEGVQQAPSILNLTVRLKKQAAASRAAAGGGAAGGGGAASRSTTAAQVADSAIPLGAGRSTRRSGQSTGGRSGGSSSTATALHEPDIIVLE